MLELNPKGYQIILASKSPRRIELLDRLGYTFTQLSKEVDESYPANLEVEKVAEYLSAKKAMAYQDALKEKELLITSDTTVCLENKILGKAKNPVEAREMLLSLSGKKHIVITGVTLKSNQKLISFSVSTEVKMKVLSEEEIEHYINNFKPFDKAGAYGIQEWIGFIGVEEIRGSFYNVMGLPLKELYEAILKF